ncbi:radical SAM protein [Coprothermobacteraceae bacterium]|nr:radical SAM protein [Coprothermobacteraceae bacterium]
MSWHLIVNSRRIYFEFVSNYREEKLRQVETPEGRGLQKDSIVYGPVKSRRFGATIGISLIPLKVCSFDCVFCELGIHTTQLTIERKHYVEIEDVLEVLRGFPLDGVDYLALSGAGEPTLAANMGQLIDALHESYPIPVLVLSNGATIYMPDVRFELAKADAVKLTFSTLDETAFRLLNQPAAGITAQKVADGIEEFASAYRGRLYFEVVVVKGINDSEEMVRDVVEFLARFNPYAIDINRPIRPGVATHIELPDKEIYSALQSDFPAVRIF